MQAGKGEDRVKPAPDPPPTTLGTALRSGQDHKSDPCGLSNRLYGLRGLVVEGGMGKSMVPPSSNQTNLQEGRWSLAPASFNWSFSVLHDHKKGPGGLAPSCKLVCLGIEGKGAPTLYT